MGYRNRGVRVKKRGINELRKIARDIRKQYQITQPAFPICQLIETLHGFGIIEFEVHEKSEMGDCFGLTCPDENKIILREDVYEDAATDGGFGRFTLSHEFGHLILHSGSRGFARSEKTSTHMTIEDSEWQSDRFAQELLVSVDHLKSGDEVHHLRRRFLVTGKAARTAYNKLVNEGIIESKGPHPARCGP